jgi:cation transport ATPase
MKKSDLQALIAADELEAVAEALLNWAKQSAAAGLYSNALIEAGRLESLKKSRIRGNEEEKDLTRQRNDIRVALVEMIEKLPETPAATARLQAQGMTESRFKILVFGLMIMGNALAFVCLFVLGEGAGGFTPPEASTTATMLISVFAAYFSVMLGEFIARRNAAKAVVEERVSRRFLWVSMGVLAAYFLSVCWLILRRPLMEFQSFISWLTMLESGLGLFVGQIVHSLFKKQEA